MPFSKEMLISVIIAFFVILAVAKYIVPLLPAPFGFLLFGALAIGCIIWVIRALW